MSDARPTSRLHRVLSAIVVGAVVLVGLAACAPLAGVVTVAVGEEYACAARADGTVVCWGRNLEGQLGDGSQADSAAPTAPVVGITNATSVVTGDQHACALLADLTVRCWGVAVLGQTGRGVGGGTGNVVEDRPVVAVGVTGATQLSAAGDHTCARMSNGTAMCWGRNNEGQLGNGTTSFTASAVAVTGLTGVAAVEVGAFHSCAVLDDGTARCWGANNRGQLGDGTTSASSAPVAVAGLTDVAEIDGGGNHTCARRSDGTVACWGRNTEGQLGDATLANRPTAAPVTGLGDVTDIATGNLHSCAVLGDGTARCWGFNGNAQLGDGSTTTATAPVAVTGVAEATAVATGAATTCTLQLDATVQCWGYNGLGGLGDATRTQRATPGPVRAGPAIVGTIEEIEAGAIHTCILFEQGTVACAGQGILNGELGNGTFANARLLVPVSDLTGVTTISAGENHTCAVLEDTTVRCWGRNVNGQLGTGSTTSSNVPVTVSGLSGVVDVEAGDDHTCAVLDDATVRCWGRNAEGQLGNGTTTQQNVPVPVPGLTGVASLGLGATHTCAVAEADGAVRCWGANAQGQLGDGTTTTATTPVAVSGLTGVADVAGGVSHTCAVLDDGTGRCWGSNGLGQLGTGGGTSLVPVAVTDLAGATQVAAGQSYTCATLGNGEGRCWGNNIFEQLGDGTSINRAFPTAIDGLSTIVAVTTATATLTNEGQHTCVLLGDGTARCWGAGGSGQLSDGGEDVSRGTTTRPMVVEG